ncbi:hypothetical protein SH668x_000214 [Planctomicrobium sp. SH668]|uniref:hypothetical protein n=1 Tax=Planctomicrobium sp. SH668 TaxID=3448126 RepID=UPI003F5BA489
MDHYIRFQPADSPASSGEPFKQATFEAQAITVLAPLQSSIAAILRTLGGINRPSALEQLLQIDHTLAWQLVKVAEAETPLEGGAHIPSRVSMKRFARSAAKLGVPAEQTKSMLQAYSDFEVLVKEQAGGRVCFNSMASAASMDEGWHVSERQHRRNIFRGVSHIAGIQASLMLKTMIYRRGGQSSLLDAISISGLVDLRLLWKIPEVNVFRSRISSRIEGAKIRDQTKRLPLSDQDSVTSYAITDFCSNPNANIRITEGTEGWILGDLIDASVGISGESTVIFGCQYLNVPNPTGLDNYMAVQASVEKPVKMAVIDVLAEPGLFTDWTASASVRLGTSMTDKTATPSEERVLPTRVELQRLGTGPAILKEYPNYPALIHHGAKQVEWEVSTYECWRLKLEYPLFQSVIRAQLTSQ